MSECDCCLGYGCINKGECVCDEWGVCNKCLTERADAGDKEAQAELLEYERSHAEFLEKVNNRKKEN